MRRYTALLITSFMLLVMAIGGSMYLSGHVENHKQAGTLPSITVYTMLPVETVAPLAEEYERNHKVKVSFIPIDEQELSQRIGDTGKADLLLADSVVLNHIAAAGWLVPYHSEVGDAVSDELKDPNGFWIGTWYDPMVFCLNRDYVARQDVLPLSWQELANSNARVGITDLLAADAASNLMFSLVSQYGEENTINMMKKLHPKTVQYSKYLSTPVRMAGMGEVDISIAVQSEVMRYINDGFPLTITYPQEGTSAILIGTGLLLNAPHSEQARAFADWLQGDEAQLTLQRNNFFFVPANRNILAYKKLTGKDIKLFLPFVDLSKERKQGLLDKWMKEVRMK